MSGTPDGSDDATDVKSDFIREKVKADTEAGTFGGRVQTRFPPEPNGWLHIGHSKSILLNYGIAQEYGGKFVLRFDDTNPAKEEQAFVDSIKHDVEWLGAHWDGEVRFASDYFGQFYDWAVELIKKGLAYVDEQGVDDIRAQRGNLKEPGKESPRRAKCLCAPAPRSIDSHLLPELIWPGSSRASSPPSAPCPSITT